MDYDPKKIKKPSGWGKRHTFAFLGFTGFALSYALRFNLSIAIVAMVKAPASNASRAHVPVFAPDACPHDDIIDADALVSNFSERSLHEDTTLRPEPEDEGDFSWNEEIQGLILGSFFWGYIVTQIPGGFLAQRFGGKWLFGGGILVSGLFALLTPMAAWMGGEWVLMAVRIGQGLGGGITVPAAHALLAKWIPPCERSKLNSVVYAGMPFGTAITMVVSGYLIHYFGWITVFYVTGIVTVAWFCLFAYVVHDSPADHPSISYDELKYIELEIGLQGSHEKLPVPWMKICKSLPFWAILICHTAETWALYTLLIELPTYLKTVLHFDMKQNSWVSAFPHLVMWAVSIFITTVSGILLDKNWVSTGTVRKVSNSIALWGSAAMMIGVAYSGCDRPITIALLTLAVGVLGGIYSGVVCNHIDIAPNFAALLMGMTNMAATLPGFLAPWAAGHLLNGNPSLEQWRKVFLLGAAIAFTGNLIYVIFTSGEEQEWNRRPDTNNREVEKNDERDDVERQKT